MARCRAPREYTRDAPAALSGSNCSNAITSVAPVRITRQVNACFRENFASLSLRVALVAATVATVSAAQLGPPPRAVLSREKLSAIDDFLNREIASGNIPGAIVLIQHHGQRHISNASASLTSRRERR